MRPGFKKVKNVFINETDTLIHISVGNTEIKTTPTHPINKGWVEAGNLNIADKLLLSSGETAKIGTVCKEVLNKPINVYNFEVEDWHTYFVSDENVLVHNSSCNFDISRWGQGSYNSVGDSFMDHYNRHKDQVGATSPEQYMRKAEEFAKNLKGARKAPVDGYTPNVTRYYKNGKYIDMTLDGKIISFGAQ